MKRATERVHPMLRHLLRGWAYMGLVMVLMAAVAALTGCGGGGTPQEEAAPTLLATSTGSAQGGNALQGLPVLAAPLVGPTINLAEATSVQVVVHTHWVQNFLGTAELAFSVTPGGASAPMAPEHAAGLGQAPNGRFSATSTWCLHLPAGQHELQAVARLRAANSAGTPSAVLGTYSAQSSWEVTTIGAAACPGSPA